MGSGLFLLGAFLIINWMTKRQSAWTWFLSVFPTAMIVLMAVIFTSGEIALALIWGIVTINLGLLGLIALVFKKQLCQDLLPTSVLDIVLGWGTCVLAGCGGKVGRFSGCGLIIVGLISGWHLLRQNQNILQSPMCQVKKNRGAYIRLFVAILLVVAGAWLMLWQHESMAMCLKIPVSVYGAVGLGTICTLPALFLLSPNGRLHRHQLMEGLAYNNVFLSTFSVGLVGVRMEQLPMTLNTLLITMPWIAVAVLVLTLMIWLPQKTARWWGGLVVLTVLLSIFSLLV